MRFYMLPTDQQRRHEVLTEIEFCMDTGDLEKLEELVKENSSWLKSAKGPKGFTLIAYYMRRYDIPDFNLSEKDKKNKLPLLKILLDANIHPKLDEVKEFDLSRTDDLRQIFLKAALSNETWAVSKYIVSEMEKYIQDIPTQKSSSNRQSKAEDFIKKFSLVKTIIEPDNREKFDKFVRKIYQTVDIEAKKDRVDDILKEKDSLINKFKVFVLELLIKFNGALHSLDSKRVLKDNPPAPGVQMMLDENPELKAIVDNNLSYSATFSEQKTSTHLLNEVMKNLTEPIYEQKKKALTSLPIEDLDKPTDQTSNYYKDEYTAQSHGKKYKVAPATLDSPKVPTKIKSTKVTNTPSRTQ